MLRSRFAPILGSIVAGAVVLGATLARADAPFREALSEAEARTAPASRYANLTNAETLALLQARRIPFEAAVPPLPGVRMPIRLTGPLRGVWIHSALPPERRAGSMFEILDGRLALVLDEFAEILAAHDVVELVHFTMYRPPTENPRDPGAPQVRHPGGLAIDFGAVKFADGEWLSVGVHWMAHIGARTCGVQARRLDHRKGREIRSIACEAAARRLFHYTLTPHYDGPHADHLHLEIRPGTTTFLVR
ncbi:MAG: extensin family protein [Polyangiaceae bacterium]|nr:extensin family protein [Polyangiaceae bacterium]